MWSMQQRYLLAFLAAFASASDLLADCQAPAAGIVTLASGNAASPASLSQPDVVSAPAASPGQTSLFSPTTYETPTCVQPALPADLSGWKRWSNLATWPNQKEIPGTNGSFSNVTVVCGDFVLFDMLQLSDGSAAVQLTWLLVEGSLMFLDDPSLPVLALDADSIIVAGNLTIGSPAQHFSQSARITLTGRTMELLPGFEDVGFKVLAAAGGQINFYGMPSGPSTPSWVSLTQPAAAGETVLNVDQNVTGWPVGGTVAISSTDFDPQQAETATIVAAAGNRLTLGNALQYSRYAPSVPTGYNNISMPMAAEVALLTRNILVTGSQEPAPNQLLGGHTIVYNTQAPQTFFGVEFTYLGQQGTLGRYPVHFHLCGPMPGSTVRSNAVHNSLQRGYVIHATHQLTAQDNVAFNTTGHTFMFEDGIEMNNTLLHNLVITSNPATVLIPEDPAPTDNTPSCFWTATPSNSWLNNSASGCTFGFWMELEDFVRGISAGLPGAAQVDPFTAPLVQFDGNTAHSNVQAGLEMYVHGYMPTSNQTFSRFNAYKNAEYGMVFHGSMRVIVDQVMVADSMTGVEFNEQSLNTLQNSIIIGQSANLGNPVNCSSPYLACEPVSGVCPRGFNYSSLPANPGPGYRTVPADAKQGSARYGVVLAANTAAGNVFANFNSSCLTEGAVGIDNLQPGPVEVTGLMINSTFINTPATNRAFIDPAMGPYLAQYWAARDADGSTIGVPGGGYLVANGSDILLPPVATAGGDNASCTEDPSWGGYSCQGVCYRSIYVQYYEPGIPALWGSGTLLNVTRASDSVNQILGAAGGGYPGTVNPATNSPSWNRLMNLNLLGGESYTVTFVGGAGVLPAAVEYGPTDVSQPSNPPCGGAVTLAFPGGVNATEMYS